MRRTRWVTYLWPGLPQLWVYGSWFGLAVAVSAALLLNVALLGTFGWSELVAADVRRVLWAVLAAVWIAWAILSAVSAGRQGTRQQTDAAGVSFAAALDYYLKGNWFQAERELVGLLRKNARDLEARLTLATLLRRTGRLDEAEEQLESLAAFQGAEKWELEIRRERELMAAVETAAEVAPDGKVEQADLAGRADPPATAAHAG